MARSHGLSTSEKVGIIVGVTVTTALVVVLVTVVCLRRRRRKQNVALHSKDHSLQSYEKPHEYPLAIAEAPVERHKRLYELHNDTGRYEADSGRVRVELGLEKAPVPNQRQKAQYGPFELAERNSVWKEPGLI